MVLLLLQSGPGKAGAAGPSAPVNSVLPVISGTTQIGSTLTTTTGTWTNSPTGFIYQWLRGGVNISGATSSTYLLVSADNAAMITVAVTATNAGGSASATSAGVGPITAPFTPASLTGLIGWWDMSASANYTISGTQVVSMVDKSGAGNTLGDGSTAQKPTYNATLLNGRPSLQCDGTVTHIDNTAFPIGTGNTLTVFGVAILSATCGNYGRLIGYGPPGFFDNNNNSSWCFLRSSTVAQMFFNRNVTGTPVINTSYTTPHRFIATVNSSGVMTVYIDGVASSTATLSANWITGGTLSVGGNVGSTAAKWASAISEIGVATGFTNATDVTSLDNYLKTKWGL